MLNRKTFSLAICLALAMVSCSSDDNGDDGNGNTATAVSSSSAGSYPASSSSATANNPSSSSIGTSSSNPTSSSSSQQTISSSSSTPSSSSGTSSSSDQSSSSAISCNGNPYDVKTQYCSNNAIKNKDTFVDARDNTTYTKITIGTQTWMAENLNFKTAKSYCYGDRNGGDIFGNCEISGRLYEWYAAMGLPAKCKLELCDDLVTYPHQGACPDGWHVPTDEEWGVLMETVEPSCTDRNAQRCVGAGLKLKSVYGWTNKEDKSSGNGIDSFGFGGLPSGRVSSDGTVFDDLDRTVGWFSADKEYNDSPYIRTLAYGIDDAQRTSHNSSFSVRCLENK